VVDPTTGLGVTDRARATVIARDATTTDAWSTALVASNAAARKKLVENAVDFSAIVEAEGQPTLETNRFPEPAIKSNR
jgi:thiamine biosynthesis lipoprotein ApbE